MEQEEILKLSEGELYEKVMEFVGHHKSFIPLCTNIHGQWEISKAVFLCYQAEEKIKGMGRAKWAEYSAHLENFHKATFLSADIAHTHPKQRAQAILLTIQEEGGRK